MSAAVQKRIISHMNKVRPIPLSVDRDARSGGTEKEKEEGLTIRQDHGDSLSDYLRYYHGVAESDISDPRMTELSDDGMTLRAHADSDDYFIPFEPPLKDLDGIRQRVIDMANEAKAELAAGRQKSYDDDDD